MSSTRAANTHGPGRSSAEPRRVPTRRVSFDEALQEVPRYFAQDGDLISGHLIAALSSVFPEGEDFFVRSVRDVRSQLEDPELKRQVAGFIGQESIHGREHRAFNERLAELGYPTRIFDRITKRGLATRYKVASAKSNLAGTAALEHFTATLAEHVLTCEETRQQMGHPVVRELFEWHALEESEHKAVAFDVYRAVGGTERMRIWTMKAARFSFVLFMGLAVLGSVAGDKRTYRPGELRASWKRVRSSPILDRALWDQLREYDRRGFHPNDRDTDKLVERWRIELFGDEGSLNSKLAGAA